MGANINIKDRELLTMSAVSEVLSFDNDYISVMTEHGKVEIEGDGMRIINMSSESGDMLVSGRIDGVFYTVKQPKKGLFKKAEK
ncbi:MAG: YabP/YqfC family sporulation protein [Oscillospiraceae bacterium]|nr:YabP/YqfC family sporulation protein [Clostridia bacterium]MBQ9857931.1 YabP/YqfC family sporulation protein [Oscillospiraceae bacterium]